MQQMLSEAVFAAQREAFQAFEMKRDFVWWMKTLVKEEVAELKEADEKQLGMEAILKELADVLYVMVGFYNCLPQNPKSLIPVEVQKEMEVIYEDALETLSRICHKYRIPPAVGEKAFMVVHQSNMTKIDPEKGVLRRSDGKVLKGRNYQAPDMTPVVQMWESFVRELRRTGQDKTAREKFEEMVQETTKPH